MVNIQLLSLDQADYWDKLVRSMDCPDVYYLSSYCALHEQNEEGKAQLFVYEDESGIVIYPFLLRDVHTLPQVTAVWPDAPPLKDMITPYGYGGPLYKVNVGHDKMRLCDHFQQAMSGYCQEANIVTEFVRFHPLYNNYDAYPDVEPVLLRHTIAIPLDQDMDTIQSQYTSYQRNRLRLAMRSGLSARVVPTEYMDEFVQRYKDTLHRLKSSSYYYFSPAYFESISHNLNEQMTLIAVYKDTQIASLVLFLHEQDYAHYHLVASDSQYFPFAPNNYLIHFAVQYFKGLGCKKLHLGGGYSGSDTLYRFKQGFNRGEPLNYYIGKKIRNEEMYNQLIHRLGGEDRSDFFPFYRNSTIEASIDDPKEVKEYV